MIMKLSRFLKKQRLQKAHKDDTSFVSKKTTYSDICKKVQNMLRNMQNMQEIQFFADRKDIRKFHDVLKTVNGFLEPPHW